MVAFALLRVSLLSSLLAGSALATPVMTPHGARDSASVHLVPEGGSVQVTDSGDVHLLDGSGSIIHISSNTSVNATVKRSATPVALASPLTAGGTVTEASWTNTATAPISIFEANWTVPPIPTGTDGQTLFLFDSLQPATGGGGLQPVLQYGPSAAGGGLYWAVATWFISGGQTFYTTPKQVTPGQAVTGVLALTSSNARSGTYSYTASFAGISGTSLQASSPAPLVTAAVSLEGYLTSKKADYPTGTTVFRNIILRAQGATPAVTYTTSGDNDQGVTGAINTNGATNAQFTVTYPS